MPTISSTTVSSSSALLKGVSGNPGAGGATQVPPGIIALPSGTVIKGEITQIDGRGNAVLSTLKGDVSLKTELPLKTGSEISLRLTTSHEGVKAKILSVNGLSPQEFTAKASNPRGQDILVDDIVQTGKQTSAKTVAATPQQQVALSKSAPLPPSVQNVIPADSFTLKAVLLSRSPELPQILQQLPSSINVPNARLEAGATIIVKLAPNSIQLPSSAQTATTTPAATTATTATPNAAPNSSTAATPPTVPAAASANSIAAPASTAVPPTATAATVASAQVTGSTATTATNVAAPTATSATSATASPSVAASTTAATVANTTAATTAPTAGQAAPTSVAASSANNAALAANNVTPTATPSAPQSNTPAATTQSTTTNAAQTTAASTNNAAATPAPTAATAAATPPAVTTAANPLTPTTAQLAQGIIPAQVIGHEQSGETVLRTSLGTLKISIPSPSGAVSNLPIGTTLNLQAQTIQLPQNATLLAAQISTAPAPLSELSIQWNSLQETIQIVAQTQPAIAAAILNNVIPKPGPRMGTAMLFFVSALRGGDINQWLGKDAIKILEQNNRGDLIKKLSAEFGTIRQFFIDSPSPNWQAAFVPINDGEKWQQAGLFLKKEQTSGAEGEAGGTRFIMELSLIHI